MNQQLPHPCNIPAYPSRGASEVLGVVRTAVQGCVSDPASPSAPTHRCAAPPPRARAAAARIAGGGSPRRTQAWDS
ncbi:MAG: hypothetical protein WDW36_004090 [Sanguina aurantia]